MTHPFRLCVGLFAACAPGALMAAPCDKAAPPADGGPRAWPTFCAIPPAPKDVRDPAAFKAAVVETRIVGRNLDEAAAAAPFSLSDTEDFAAHARNDATPPPPITTAGAPDSAAFVDGARASQAPPIRPH